MTGSGAAGQIRRDIGDLSREIAAFAPERVGKQFETRRLQCAACLDAEALAATPPTPCPYQMQSVCTLPVPAFNAV
jgi:hypothetical protein